MVTTWDGDSALTFEADVLAKSTSAAEGKERWRELTLWRTAAGTYIVTGVGRSTVEGEIDFHWINVQSVASNIVRALARRRKVGRGYVLPDDAVDLLEAAALVDPEIDHALDEFFA